MAKNWDEYIPPKVVARIRKDLLSKDANVFYGDEPGKYGSRRYKIRAENNMRVKGGTISKDGRLFYDTYRKRWVRLELAILEKRITFVTSHYSLEQFLKYIERQENGFMNALIPLLSRYDPPTTNKKSLSSRLHWLTHFHKQGDKSRNFIDPFFHEVLDILEKRLPIEMQKVAQQYG